MPRSEALLPVSNRICLHTIITSSKYSTSNPTLLLLHFWGGSNKTFSALLDHLEQDFNTITPTQRGWGNSSKPKDARAYSILDYAQDILDLLEYLQTTRPEILAHGVILVGHSMGGKISQYLLTQSKVASLMKGLVLLAPAPSSGYALPEEMREQQIHAYDSIEAAESVIKNVLLGRPDTIAHEALLSLAADAFGGADGAKQAWPRFAMAEDYQDHVISAVQLHKPRTLVVVGECDRVETPENVQAKVVKPFVKAGAKVKVEVLPDVGHLSAVEAPQALAAILVSFVQGSEFQSLNYLRAK